MTIGKLAAAAGVPTSTVRFYERAGLITPDERTGGNYRAYGEQTVERLRFVRSAQATGLSVKDIGELLQLTETDVSPCAEVQQLLERRLEDVRQKMSDLKRVEKTLKKALDICCDGGDPGLCEKVVILRRKKIRNRA